ncbi:MAG: hypothetical protein CMJ64_14205 [Planctomycetaceae bacterium]|nr:hypothetical protein [Planctomycetaceae bacterium]
MTKYLAIIKDSFREALASRVLWIVLVLITLFLLAIAPLGYHEVLTWELGDNDVRPWEELMDKVRDEGKSDEATPAKRIWESLDGDTQKQLATVAIPGIDSDAANPGPFFRAFRKFRGQLNETLGNRDFYQPDSFKDVAMVSQELRDLRGSDIEELSELEVKRFNRLLLEASFPDEVRGSPPTSIQSKYGWWDFADPFPLRGAVLQETLQSSVSIVMNWFVGAIGVIVAILVTAPIVPQMFDQGALHLLLSKPISRWLLFLSKFLGGCAFIGICASYLVAGLWLILGSRFGVWEPKLLLGVPIYLFVFAVYYSVSALAGVIYRSPIVCIVVTILFWLACFSVGLTKLAFENTLWDSAKIKQVFEAGDTLIAVNELGIAHEWDASGNAWEEVFVSRIQRQARFPMLLAPEARNSLAPVGPAYDSKNDRLVSVQLTIQPPGSAKLVAADRSDGWEPEGDNNAPSGTRAIFQEPTGSVLLVSRVGVFRITDNPLKEQKPIELFGFELPLPTAGPIENVGPRDEDAIVLTNPATASMNQSTGELALYTRGTITLLKANDRRRYEPFAEHELDGEERQPVVMALGGSTVLLGRNDGRVQALDLKTFEERLSANPEESNQPRFVTASPNGRWFAIVFHTGKLWLYDAQSNEITQARVAGQGDISCAAFSKDNSLYVAEHAVRLSKYSLPDFNRTERYAPSLGVLLTGYRYGLLPIYTIFPKPGELGTTFDYFLSEKKTETSSNNNLSDAQRTPNPWTPVWSSALFMIVVLTIACVYIEWQEF